jgi:para-nitrobenzyl esterase
MTKELIAATAQGRLRGARDGAALRFLGVPYAQSPLTAGRFAAPVPHPRWDGVRDALAYGATSPQPDRGVTLIPEPIIGGDNELNLNVFTPELGPAGLPVLVWIHGGGFFGGCNASPWYRGVSFARGGVVLVSINYRLGAEGFLEVPGAPANRAVLDWVQALEWVQQNIAAFGGDPGKVTIGGQSAGGAACGALLGVPAARGLFRGAICMSGAALGQTPAGVKQVATRMSVHLGLPRLDRAALEELPGARILAAADAVQQELAPGQPGAAASPAAGTAAVAAALGGVRLPWGPWTDGEVVTQDPFTAARRGAVAVLAGATAHEFNMGWLGAGWVTAGMVRDGLARAGVPDEAAAAYLERAGARPQDAVGQALSDRTFRVPAQRLAAATADGGGAAWAYDFRWAAPGGPLRGMAFHCLDVPFAFGTTGEPGVAEAAGGPVPAGLAAQVHGSLVRFVTDGDPGWPRYDSGTRAVMGFGEPSSVLHDPLRSERLAWSGS